jgi:hypothetical protein
LLVRGDSCTLRLVLLLLLVLASHLSLQQLLKSVRTALRKPLQFPLRRLQSMQRLAHGLLEIKLPTKNGLIITCFLTILIVFSQKLVIRGLFRLFFLTFRAFGPLEVDSEGALRLEDLGDLLVGDDGAGAVLVNVQVLGGVGELLDIGQFMFFHVKVLAGTVVAHFVEELEGLGAEGFVGQREFL